MKSWRDSFVGSTFRGGFESSIFGDGLKDLINGACQADNACLHATIAADRAFFTASMQAEGHDHTGWHRCSFHRRREG